MLPNFPFIFTFLLMIKIFNSLSHRSPIDKHLDCFQSFNTTNNSKINILVLTAFGIFASISYE